MANEDVEAVEREVEAIAEAVLEGKDTIEIPPDVVVEEPPALEGRADPPPVEAPREPAFGRDSVPGPSASRGEAQPGLPPRASEEHTVAELVKEMTVAQRVKAALRGNRDARAILMHDPNPLIQRMVLQNPRVTDDEVLELARDRGTPPEVLRAIAERRHWATNYSIRTALLANPRAPREARGFASRDEREPAKAHAAPSADRPAARHEERAPDRHAAAPDEQPKTDELDSVESEREVNAIAEAVRQGTDHIDVPDDFTHEAAAPRELAEEAKSLYARIKAMSVPQKVKLAMKGNKDARSILIRDPNKLIQRMVLQNARITEDEILALSKDRNTEKEVLRMIADNKEWLKNYAIRLGLVENSKTPLGDALRLLPALLERDMKNLARSKNVSSTVVAQVRKLLHQREQAQRSGGGHR